MVALLSCLFAVSYVEATVNLRRTRPLRLGKSGTAEWTKFVGKFAAAERQMEELPFVLPLRGFGSDIRKSAKMDQIALPKALCGRSL